MNKSLFSRLEPNRLQAPEVGETPKNLKVAIDVVYCTSVVVVVVLSRPVVIVVVSLSALDVVEIKSK